MRRHLAALASLLLTGCRGSSEPSAPILTLVPAAMQTAGPASNADDHTRCLIAGASVEASVYTKRATVTIFVVAFTPTPDTTPSFELHWGPRTVATNTIRTVRAEASVYRVESDEGEQVLRIAVPPISPGVLCLNQVVVTQP
jgi:hypothetical protein